MDDISVFQLLIKVCRAHYKNTHHRLQELELYRGQPALLHFLWKKEGRTQKNLSKKLKSKPATIAKMVKRMESEGFIVKKTDKKDRRLSRIYLTEKGKNIQQKVKMIENDIEKICLQDFNSKEISLLIDFLKRITDNLENNLKENKKEDV